MKIEEKFEHILKNSIHIQDPDDMNTIAWFYPNESELRHKKLCEVLNREYKVVNLDNYDLMIEQNVKNDTFWLHYDRIWSVFYNEKGWNYSEVQAFTQERLEQHLKTKEITTGKWFVFSSIKLEQHLKTKEITTTLMYGSNLDLLEQHLKTKEITTSSRMRSISHRLEQHLKTKEITTLLNFSWRSFQLEQHLKTKEITTPVPSVAKGLSLEQHLKTKEITTRPISGL